MATAIPQLFNSQDFAVIAELLYRRTGLLVRSDQVTYVLTATPGTESATDSFVGYGDGTTQSYFPQIGNVRVDSGLTVTTLRQTLNGVTTVVDPSNYSIGSGQSIDFVTPPPKTARLHGDFTGVPSAYLTLSAVPTLPDLSRGPFVGTVRLELDPVGLASQIPAILVYSDAFPPTADDLITYMQLHFGFHMTDNEFFIVSDASHTPLARGGGQIDATLDENRQFYLEATNQSIRWQAGSRITMQQQSLQSIVPDGLFAFVGAPVNGSLGEPYNYTFQTVNGVEPITYSVISGIPPCPIDPATGAMHADQLNSLASYSWVIEATDGNGNLTTKNCIMRVEITQLSMSPDTTTPSWIVGVPQTLNFNPYGGQRPFHYAVTSGALPSGLSIVGDGLQGTMEGNPSPSNTSLQQIFTILATDNQGQTTTMNFNATINDRTATAIRASLNAKVVSWWEASYDLYPSGQLHDGDILYDCAGRLNLTVKALTAGASITLAPTGRSGSPYAFVFDTSPYSTPAVAQALSTAHGLTGDFTYVGVVNVPSTTNVVEGQVLMGQGGTALGGTSLNVGPGGNTLSVAVDVSGVPTVTDFGTTLPVGVGNWSFVNALRYQGTPTLILNSGSTENGSPVAGPITGNATQYFTLGSDPTLDPDMVFNGGLGMASIYQSKLWSDERKWLWNNGALRRFQNLGFFIPAVSITPPTYSTTWIYGSPLTIECSITGGSGTYINVTVSAGALPPGMFLSFDGIATITISGSPTQLGAWPGFTIKAVSTDGNYGTFGFNAITVVNEVVPLVDLAMSGSNGQTSVTDTTGRIWTLHGDAQIKTDVDPNGAMYFSGTGGGYLSTPFTHDMDLINTSFTAALDFYLLGSGNWYMVGAGDSLNIPLFMGAFGTGGLAYAELAWLINNQAIASTSSAGAETVAKTTWNRMKGVFNAATGEWQIFVNGQYASASTWAGAVHSAVNSSDVLIIGANYLSGGIAQSPYAGYLRNFNWTTGIVYDTLALKTTGFGTFIPNQSGSFTTAILGGNGTYTVNASGLPAGLTATLVNGNAVSVAGTTSVSNGIYNATITLTSGDGQNATVPITVVVGFSTLTVTPNTLPNGTVGQSYSQSVALSGGDGNYSVAFLSGTSLPNGLTGVLSGNTYTVSGTPTTASNATVSIQFSSGDGQSVGILQTFVVVSVQATFSPTNVGSSIVLSNGNTLVGTTSVQSGASSLAVSSTARASGKYYLEMSVLTQQESWQAMAMGLCTPASPLNANSPGNDIYSWGSTNYGTGGTSRQIQHSASNVYQVSSVAETSPGQIVRIAVDVTNGYIWLSYIGNVASSPSPTASAWVGGGDPNIGSSPTIATSPGTVLLFTASPSDSGQHIQLTDPSGWQFAAPSGFSVWTNTPLLTLTGTWETAVTGTPYSSDLTIAGGDGVYSNPRVTVGSLPTWATLSIVSGKLRLSGTPSNNANSVNLTVAVDSGDGQTTSSAQTLNVTLTTFVASLMHFDSTPLTDIDAQNWTATGSAAIDTAQSAFGGKSLYCPANGSYIGRPWPYQFNKRNFCIEGRAYIPSSRNGYTNSIFSKNSAAGTQEIGIVAGSYAGGYRKLVCQVWLPGAAGSLDTTFLISAVNAIPLDAFFHYAVTYDQSTYRLFVNGVVVASHVNPNSQIYSLGLNDGGNIYYGYSASSTYGLTGWIDETRITIGDAIYTGAFTPPGMFATAVSLLRFQGTNGSTVTTDDVSANTWTVNSGSNISTAKPLFSLPALHCNGSSYGCTYLSGPLGGPGTGDFTIEMFVDFENISANGNQAFFNMNAGSSYSMFMYKATQQIYVTDPSGANILNSGSTVITQGVYAHVALVRKSGVLSLFVSGTKTASTAFTANISTMAPYLGSANYGGVIRYLDGYVGQFRICYSALYDANFTPPTDPFTVTPGQDPYWSLVTSLMHFDGALSSTVITDQKGILWTAYGNAQLSTADRVFGSSSVLFDGNGDYIVSSSSGDKFAIFGGAFTVEFFTKFASSAGNQCLLEIGGDQTDRLNISLTGNINVYTQTGASGSQKIAATAPSVNTWHHIALVRRLDATLGWILTLYVDGVDNGYSTTTVFPASTSPKCGIGSNRATGSLQDFAGYIDEFRVTKGLARYASNFTPPTAPFAGS